MNYLNKMYGRGNKPAAPSSDKNPNRVAGGIRGQGADTITLLGEDGVQRILPTQKYVESLRNQIDNQKSVINVLERKLTRLERDFETLSNFVKR